MEKLIKINNEVYLLMQDIIKLIEKGEENQTPPPYNNSCHMVDVKIMLKELIFEPSQLQLQKALSELKFLFNGWVKCNENVHMHLYLINMIYYTEEYLFFKIPLIKLVELKNVSFNLSKYIDEYIE